MLAPSYLCNLHYISMKPYLAEPLQRTHPQRPLLKMSPTDGDETSRGGILRMEDTGTSEEDDIDSQDSNTPIDHGHLARNCLIKITTPAVINNL